MTKPVIITRIGKGSELTFQEGDDNFTNLRDATISVSANSGSTQNIDLNGTIEIAGGTGIDTVASEGKITISGFDGDYESLSNKPALFDGEYSSLSGTPTLATVATSGSYTDLSDTPTIPSDSDSISEGTTNLYFTEQRARDSLSAGTGISITDGVITSTVTSGIANVVEDTTPQLGGGLDVNGFDIFASGDSDVVPGSGDIVFTVGDNGRFAVIGDGVEIEAPTGVTQVGILSSSGADLVLESDLASAIIVGADGNIAIEPGETGKTVTNRLTYNEAIHSLGTTSGTVSPNAANGNVQTITLNGNLTLNAFTSPVAGQSVTLIINTNGTGRTLTSSMKFSSGEKTLSDTSTTDIISVFYDGTNYWASLSKDFK